jgi:signal transduction histidine kinase
MLDDFLVTNREAILSLSRARVASRKIPKPTDVELRNGVPVFLDQLGDALRIARSSNQVDHEELGKSAARHGHDLLRMGLSIGQVVHGYGDVCQVVTELAVRKKAPISGDEFRTLNLCLDDAIAEAVTEYSHQRENGIRDANTERLGMLAHELRNYLNVAMLSFESIRSGQVAPAGSTAMVLNRSLLGLRNLIDQTLADVRLDAGVKRFEPISVAELVEEVDLGASMQARARDLHFTATSVDRALTIEGDRPLLIAALSNLVQNALKFTRKRSNVTLTTHATVDRVLFDIADECGGLPPGKTEELFLPYEQRNFDRSGAGLGLAISQRAAKANGGEIRVRDIPGTGCVFTLDLPRKTPTMRSNPATA